MELSRRHLLRRSWEAGLALALLGTGGHALLSLGAPYPNAQRRVSAEWLRRTRPSAQTKLRLLDARPALVYRQGHLPGAVNVWDSEINVWGDVPRQLAPLEELARVFGQAGIDRDTTVVVYDGGDLRWGPRLVWALDVVGHPDVRLLAGGLPAWQAAGGELTTTEPAASPTGFSASPPEPPKRVGGTWLRERVAADGSPEGVALLDARPFPAYAEGHIPGARSLPSASLLRANGRFRRAHTLHRRVHDAGVSDHDGRQGPIVVYSETGRDAARVYLALTLLGVSDVRIYDGGWAEWSTLEGAPVAQASARAVSAEADHRSTCW